MSEPLAVSVKRASELLDFKSTSKVYELIDRGVLPTVANLKPLRIPMTALKRYAEKGTDA